MTVWQKLQGEWFCVVDHEADDRGFTLSIEGDRSRLNDRGCRWETCDDTVAIICTDGKTLAINTPLASYEAGTRERLRVLVGFPVIIGDGGNTYYGVLVKTSKLPT